MQGDSLGMIGQFLPLVLMGGVMYFMFIRPQKQQQQKRQEMLEALKRGYKVITVGGMIGVITKIDEKYVTLKVAENVEIEFLRTAVGHVEAEAAPAKVEETEVAEEKAEETTEAAEEKKAE